MSAFLIPLLHRLCRFSSDFVEAIEETCLKGISFQFYSCTLPIVLKMGKKLDVLIYLPPFFSIKMKGTAMIDLDYISTWAMNNI